MEEAVLEAGGGVGEGVLVGIEVLECVFWEEVLFAPSAPIASGF